ncbi:MAG: hypothetical protein GEU99_04460 [Luteitalea sp.]|nr:hypothetical protein [Luteitalea sp.]
MTEPELTCRAIDGLLADLVDDTLDPAAAARAEAHLSTCARCGALVRDLREVRQAAAGLPSLSPPPDAWTRIRAVLEAEQSSVQSDVARPQDIRPVATRPWPPVRAIATPRKLAVWGRLAAAAAVLVLATGAGLWSLWTTRERLEPVGSTRTEAGDQRAGDLVATVESEIELAAEHYENAIAALAATARASGTELDPAVMATLKTNLALVDQAIDDSRRALRAQPDNLVAQASLLDAFRRKVTLLEDTLVLMRELRTDASTMPIGLDEG